MLTNQKTRQIAHHDIDRIFKRLLLERGMAERPGQIALAHGMLDAMLTGGIGLSDAGTGIGKTYAYLVAGTTFLRVRASLGLKLRPILVSTSSIALQSAIQDDYLPFLSSALIADGMIAQPLRAAIRKGKSHYVCDMRLSQRLGQINPNRKNHAAAMALRSLRVHLDTDEVVHLSAYDRERVCVPQVCDCRKQICRYQQFLEDCESDLYARYRQKMEERKLLLRSVKGEYANASAELDTLKAEIIKALQGKSTFSKELLGSMVSEAEAKCTTLKEQLNAAQSAYDEGQAVMADLNAQYEDVISWAEMYSTANLEARKMIINCLIKRVEVHRDYKLHIDFNIDLEQFSLGMDIVTIAA